MNIRGHIAILDPMSIINPVGSIHGIEPIRPSPYTNNGLIFISGPLKS